METETEGQRTKVRIMLATTTPVTSGTFESFILEKGASGEVGIEAVIGGGGGRAGVTVKRWG